VTESVAERRTVKMFLARLLQRMRQIACRDARTMTYFLVHPLYVAQMHLVALLMFTMVYCQSPMTPLQNGHVLYG